MAVCCVSGFAYEVDSEQTVTATRIFVQLVRAEMTVLHALMQHCYDVILAGTLYNHQIFHEKAVLNIPSTSQNAT